MKRDTLFDLIRADHETIAGLLEELEQTSERAEKKRLRLFRSLFAELTTHAEIEERILYPRLQGVRDTANLGYRSEEEHGLMKYQLHKLDNLEPTDERWLPSLRVLKEIVAAHVKEEERQMFRALRVILTHTELETLAAEFETAKSGELPLKRSA